MDLKLESFNCDFLLKKLKSITSIENGNRIVCNNPFEYEDIVWTFLSLINLGGLKSVESKKEILEGAFKQLALTNNYDKESFGAILKEQINKHSRKPEKEFFLLTSLSIKELPIRNFSFGSSRITIAGKQFPKQFTAHRNSLPVGAKDKVIDQDENYLKIIVSVKSRDYRDAFEKAYSSIEAFRGILCLLTNYHSQIQFGSVSQEPINRVRQGEYLSLHLEDGTCAENSSLWHEPNYKASKPLEFKEEKHALLKKIIKLYNKCLPKHKNTIEKALNIYVSAFDETNKSLCFLGVWTALETLLCTHLNEKVIQRCAALYEADQKVFQRQILEGLRIHRNDFVHEWGKGLDSLVACYNAQKQLYNLIILFNLRFAGFFKNIQESTMFLDDYGSNLDAIKTKKKIILKVFEMKNKSNRKS